ncbi:MAG TPA: hypothetical protein VNT54_10800 [Solirubrobacteraceae bacterium]|nr:hypothetical protein [Solirubrobacteraceae bacterium]
MKLGRPSPALVISCIAFVVACTGTAFAATMITSSKQIKNGVISSADIRDKSIQGRDIKNGTITRNKLSRGAAAVTGSSAGGGGGASTAYHAIRKAGPEGQPANVNVKVATLNVPAGAYHVTATTIMHALPGPQGVLAGLTGESGAVGGRCRLDAAGDVTESLQNVVVNGRGAPATLVMQATRTVGEAAEIVLECAAGVPFRLSETAIVATRASDIQLSVLPQ